MNAPQTVGNWRRILGSLAWRCCWSSCRGRVGRWPCGRISCWSRTVLGLASARPHRFWNGIFSCLLADFQDGAVFGQHAIAYVIGVYLVLFLRLRLLQFDPFRQAAQLFPILLTVQLAVLLVGWLAVNPPTGLVILLPVLSSTLLWYLIAGFVRLWHGKGLRDQA